MMLPGTLSPDSVGLVVIEDDWFTVDQIAGALAGSRYRIIEAVPTVDRALNVLAQLRPRAAILDGTLRGQSTTGVARHLQSTRTPFLMLTGSQPVYTSAIGQSIPALLKPFGQQELLATLDSLPIAVRT